MNCALQKLRVVVTEDHINQCRASGKSICPVETAIYDRYPQIAVACIASRYSRMLTRRGVLTQIQVPESVVVFTFRFDSGSTVSPIAFDLEVSEQFFADAMIGARRS